ncbi:MAG: type II toxin-antitoxin system RelE/ParE family toxin [Candidatus Kuenenia sp.]|nr:type II toxin-antitoxin system RelE/ParE family toxin [Candidatus Kuenenia hertensis]
MYKLILQKSARKELDKIPDPFFIKIDEAILSLKENPYPFPQSRKLKGEDKRRLRVGDFRVIYTVDEERKVITIYRIRHRKDVYQ